LERLKNKWGDSFIFSQKMQHFLIVSRIMASKAKTGDQGLAKREEHA